MYIHKLLFNRCLNKLLSLNNKNQRTTYGATDIFIRIVLGIEPIPTTVLITSHSVLLKRSTNIQLFMIVLRPYRHICSYTRTPGSNVAYADLQDERNDGASAVWVVAGETRLVPGMMLDAPRCRIGSSEDHKSERWPRPRCICKTGPLTDVSGRIKL